jgi:hypothetical protein
VTDRAAVFGPASTFSPSTGSRFVFELDASAAAVPEPSSLALLGLGAAGLIGYGVRKRMRAA